MDLLPVILDNGAHTIKCGTLHQEHPYLLPNYALASSDGTTILGQKVCTTPSQGMEIIHSTECGFPVHWVLETQIWNEAFNLFDVQCDNSVLYLSLPPKPPQSVIKNIANIAFEYYGFRGICIGNSGLFMSHSISPNGTFLVIDIGYTQCTIYPILNGKIISEGVSVSPTGTRALTTMLSKYIEKGQNRMIGGNNNNSNNNNNNSNNNTNNPNNNNNNDSNGNNDTSNNINGNNINKPSSNNISLTSTNEHIQSQSQLQSTQVSRGLSSYETSVCLTTLLLPEVLNSTELKHKWKGIPGIKEVLSYLRDGTVENQTEIGSISTFSNSNNNNMNSTESMETDSVMRTGLTQQGSSTFINSNNNNNMNTNIAARYSKFSREAVLNTKLALFDKTLYSSSDMRMLMDSLSGLLFSPQPSPISYTKYGNVPSLASCLSELEDKVPVGFLDYVKHNNAIIVGGFGGTATYTGMRKYAADRRGIITKSMYYDGGIWIE